MKIFLFYVPQLKGMLKSEKNVKKRDRKKSIQLKDQSESSK